MRSRRLAGTKLSDGKVKEIKEFARGWGKLLAREAFPDGVGLDVTLADMEDIVAAATRALVEGSVETMTDDQAQAFGAEAPCPTCGKLCQLQRKPRPITVRGGTASLEEVVGHCSTCRRDFFPSA